MRTSNLLTFWVSLLFAGRLIAQDTTIEGKVTDAASGEPLISATVAMGTTTGAITDLEGAFRLTVPPGTYQLKVSYIGYRTYEETVELTAGETRQLDLALKPAFTVLETATVTTGKYEKPLSEVTVSLEVLQPRLIENANKLSLDDALEKVPGVTIIDGQANIRGGSGYSQGAGSRVLLLVDDIPILQPDAGFPNWVDVPVENIAQVEVLKGAASALYGSSALNGIVNVRTAYPKAEPETIVSAYYTHYFKPEDEEKAWWDSAPRTLGASVAHRRKIDKLDLVLGGFYFDEESFNQNTYNQFGRFNFNTRYRATDRLSFGLNANFNYGENGGFFYWADADRPYNADTSSVSRRDRFRYNLDPHLTYFDGAGNRHRVLGRFFFTDNNDLGGNQSNRSNSYYGEYQFQRNIESAGLVLTAGIVGLGTSTEAELYGDTTFTATNFAGYVQLDKALFERLNVSAGFRFEANRIDNPGFTVNDVPIAPSDETDSRPVFRLGLNYRAAEATFLRASWGQGYRFPSIAEKFIFTNAGGVTILPNPALDFETGWSGEIGLKQGFRFGSFEGFVDLAAFISRFDNMVEFNFNFTPFGLGFSAVNTGGTQIQGLEASVAGRGEIADVPFNLLAGYTYIDPTFDNFDTTRITDFETATEGQINADRSSSNENVLKYRSKHLFKLDAEATPGRFTLGAEVFHNSRIEAIDGILLALVPGLQEYREANDQGFTVVNFRAGYQITKPFRLMLLLGNAFNVEYSTRPGLLEAPRNFTARIDYRF